MVKMTIEPSKEPSLEPLSYLEQSIEEKNKPKSTKEELVLYQLGNFDYRSDTEIPNVEDIVISLDIQYALSGSIITVEHFRKIILNYTVPVATCMVALMGLPSSGKTTILENVLKEKINLSSSAQWSVDDYMARKRNDRCLSLYELCILGGSLHNQYAWSFATNRCGAVYSIFYSLISQCSDISTLEFQEMKFPKPTSHLERHLLWLMKYAKSNWNAVVKNSDKLTLFNDGLSLVNVIDVGVNKALYDFLPIMLAFCNRLVRLTCFSMERDGLDLDKTPELSSSKYGTRKDDVVIMKRRPRLTYFLHFGTVGLRKPNQQKRNSISGIRKKDNVSTNIVIAVRSNSELSNEKITKDTIQRQAKSQEIDHFFTNWVNVNQNDKNSIKQVGDKLQDFIKEIPQYIEDLPLKWIVLRSLVVSLSREGKTPMILHKSQIVKVAKELEMEERDVDDFLEAFTAFGSILYISEFTPIRDLVIVDIWQFTQYLDQLFYPDPTTSHGTFLTKYGIITKLSTKEILGDNMEDFMQLITTFAMAAQIKNGNPVLNENSLELFSYEEYYYLPSARVCPFYESLDNDYAFLEITSVNFPANVQACISHGIMKNNPDVFLIATEENNVSRFEFHPKDHPVIRIEMIYGGSRTKLRVIMNDEDDHEILTSPATIKACSQVLIGCCSCLERKTNLIRNLKYDLGIPCCKDGSSHFIYSDDQSDVCDACTTNSSENKFRLCWIEAAKQINEFRKEMDPKSYNMLAKTDSHRLKQDQLEPDDIFDIGKELYEHEEFNAKKLVLQLNIDFDVEKEEHEGVWLAMAILMKWKSSMKGKAYKRTLAQLLKKANYPDIAQMLNPESIVS